MRSTTSRWALVSPLRSRPWPASIHASVAEPANADLFAARGVADQRQVDAIDRPDRLALLFAQFVRLKHGNHPRQLFLRVVRCPSFQHRAGMADDPRRDVLAPRGR